MYFRPFGEDSYDCVEVDMLIVTLQPGKTKYKVDIFERRDVSGEILDGQVPNFDIDGDDLVNDAAVFVATLTLLMWTLLSSGQVL